LNSRRTGLASSSAKVENVEKQMKILYTLAVSFVCGEVQVRAMAMVYFYKSRIVSLMMFLIGCGFVFTLAFTKSERMKSSVQRPVLFAIKNKSSVSTDDAFSNVRRPLTSPAAESVVNKPDSVEALAAETLNEKQVALSADDIALDVPDTILDIDKDQETMDVPQLSPQMLEKLLQNDEDANNVDSQPADPRVPAAKVNEPVEGSDQVPKVI
jgi:hypothetical protein